VLTPDARIVDAPSLDVLHVPGGHGQDALMEDEEVLGWLRHQAQGACAVLLVYAPDPPFDSGTPQSARPDVMSAARAAVSEITRRREATARRISAKLGIGPLDGAINVSSRFGYQR
jgi:hypothetical protein